MGAMGSANSGRHARVVKISEDGSFEFDDHVRDAIGLLLQAADYAQDLDRSHWDFAVEKNLLLNEQLTENDLRWLMLKGLLEHGIEDLEDSGGQREFHPTCDLRFYDGSCFVLTREGVLRARSFLGSEPKVDIKWDGETHCLFVREIIVKEFRLPSPNQEKILSAFQEENWPKRIDDPLPQTQDVAPKRRLNDTIKALNRNQKAPLIRFQGDGTGEGVTWRLLDYVGSQA